MNMPRASYNPRSQRRPGSDYEIEELDGTEDTQHSNASNPYTTDPTNPPGSQPPTNQPPSASTSGVNTPKVQEVDDEYSDGGTQEIEYDQFGRPYRRYTSGSRRDYSRGSHGRNAYDMYGEYEDDYGDPMMDPFFSSVFGARSSGRRNRRTSALEPFGGSGLFGMGGFGSMFGDMMSPFGFSIEDHMRDMQSQFEDAFRGTERASREGGATMFCSSTVETIGPNGTREVRHTSRDSRTGKQRSVHTRSLGDKTVSEVAEKDMVTGVEQRRTDTMGVENGDVSAFDREWILHGSHALGGGRNAPRSLMGPSSSNTR